MCNPFEVVVKGLYQQSDIDDNWKPTLMLCTHCQCAYLVTREPHEWVILNQRTEIRWRAAAENPFCPEDGNELMLLWTVTR
jgi:hypothetical protein